MIMVTDEEYKKMSNALDTIMEIAVNDEFVNRFNAKLIGLILKKIELPLPPEDELNAIQEYIARDMMERHGDWVLEVINNYKKKHGSV